MLSILPTQFCALGSWFLWITSMVSLNPGLGPQGDDIWRGTHFHPALHSSDSKRLFPCILCPRHLLPHCSPSPFLTLDFWLILANGSQYRQKRQKESGFLGYLLLPSFLPRVLPWAGVMCSSTTVPLTILQPLHLGCLLDLGHYIIPYSFLTLTWYLAK